MRNETDVSMLPLLSPAARLSSLTRMELVVLVWIERGKTNEDIATILARSKRTIDSHVGAILKKLCVETRGAAAALMRDLQIQPR